MTRWDRYKTLVRRQIGQDKTGQAYNFSKTARRTRQDGTGIQHSKTAGRTRQVGTGIEHIKTASRTWQDGTDYSTYNNYNETERHSKQLLVSRWQAYRDDNVHGVVRNLQISEHGQSPEFDWKSHERCYVVKIKEWQRVDNILWIHVVQQVSWSGASLD